MSEKLDRARRRADDARARLRATVAELQHRVEPATVLEEVVAGAKTRSADAAEAAARVVCERPGTVAAAFAGGALLLARRPIGRLLRRLTGRGRAGDETTGDDRSFNA